jgi:hypothetical protein
MINQALKIGDVVLVSCGDSGHGKCIARIEKEIENNAVPWKEYNVEIIKVLSCKLKADDPTCTLFSDIDDADLIECREQKQ